MVPLKTEKNLSWKEKKEKSAEKKKKKKNSVFTSFPFPAAAVLASRLLFLHKSVCEIPRENMATTGE